MMNPVRMGVARQRALSLALLLLLLPFAASSADDEASNIPHVVANERCYAKSVPAERYGEEGVTKVFWVEKGDDRLIHTVDRFSRRIFLRCVVERPDKPANVAKVLFGPWARGQSANDKDLAMAFYWGGELVARYSTLDIAGRPDNVSASISHYTVLEEVEGFRCKGSNLCTFEVVTTDGRHLSFDLMTGKRL